MLEPRRGRDIARVAVLAACVVGFLGASACRDRFWFEDEDTHEVVYHPAENRPTPTEFEIEVQQACDAALNSPCPANDGIEDGETQVFLPPPDPADFDEILARIDPLHAAVGSGATGALIALDGSSQVFLSDEAAPWYTIDLARFFPNGPGALRSGVVVDHRILIGTDQGIAWLDARDGTHGFFSGVPSGSTTIALAPDGAGGALAGVSVGYASGQGASIYRCSLASGSCTLSNAGTSASENGRPASDFASVGAGGGAARIYAGTWGGGLYVSADHGATWAPASSGISASRVWRVCASGTNLLAGTSAGLYVSGNGGASWTRPASLPSGDVHGIDASGATVYAGVNTANGTALSAAVYKSTDGGGSWQPTGPHMTASVVNSMFIGTFGVYAGTRGGNFRSTDGGATWAPFNSGLSDASVLTIAPSGGSLYAGTWGNRSGVYRSTDGGKTWTPGAGSIANATVRSIAVSGATVVAAGDNGSFRSTDAGVTWSAATAGLPASAKMWCVVWDGTAFYGGAPGAVYRSADGGTWTPVAGAVGAGTPITALAAASGNLWAASGPAVYRSTNGGASWAAGAPIWPADTAYSVSSITPVGGVLYAALYGLGTPETHGVYKSLDNGATWSRASAGLPTNSPAYSVASVGSALFAALQGGLYETTDGGIWWVPAAMPGIPVYSAASSAGTLYVGPAGRSVVRAQIPAHANRLVPIVLDVDTGSARYTTELSIANSGSTPAAVTITYTASIGSGSGTVSESLAAGQQLVVPDAIGYLRGKGLSIPGSGSQGGTLLLGFDGLSSPAAAVVTARTAAATSAPQPVGRAGLAYTALDPDRDGVVTALTVYGLRSNSTDRSNLAVFNTGSTGVTLKVTAFSGDGDGRSAVVAEGDVLPAWGWKQYNGILAGVGMDDGWATVEQVPTGGAWGTFSAYGVVNDQKTNDGSYILPTTRENGLSYLTVPVLVETPSFVSELVLSNSGATPATLTLTYAESLSPASGAGGSFAVTLPPGTQRIVPSAIAFFRSNGVPIGAPGGSYAGSLHVAVAGANVNDVFAGARTASQSPAGGQFGLFTPCVYPGGEAFDTAYVFGLRSDANDRSNVAVMNTAQSASAGPITLQLQAYDGDAGGAARGAPLSVTLAPGQWGQPAGFFGASGVANGWVKVTRTAGTAPWIAYGVVNDGGGPGQRTGDGAYVPMVR